MSTHSRLATTPLTHIAVIFVAIAAATLSALAGPSDVYLGSTSQNTIFDFIPNAPLKTFTTGFAATAMAFDSHGNLFVDDGIAIKKVDPAGVPSSFAPNISSAGLAFDRAGNLFVATTGNTAEILKITPDGKQSVFASGTPSWGLTSLEGLAVDALGNVYVADFQDHYVLKFGPDGSRTIFATGVIHARGLAVDQAGNLFVSDAGSTALGFPASIYKITPSGVRFVIASGIGNPGGITFDNSGNVFVSVGEGIFEIPAGSSSMVLVAQVPGGPGPVASIERPGLANISTRGLVQDNNHALIAGFIISGTDSKTVLIRALGPSLAPFGIANFLQDPMLILHDGTGGVIAVNDDFSSTAIPASFAQLARTEAAILITLRPGSYTAVESGKNGASGVSLVEVYDLTPDSASRLSNLSTRGFVEPNNPMIAGLIVRGGIGSRGVVIRTLGPSLRPLGVPDPLANPTLEVHDANGVLISNDNWQTTSSGQPLGDKQRTAIETTGYAPPNPVEAAVLTTLVPGNYTVVVRGQGSGAGVALVEAYTL